MTSKSSSLRSSIFQRLTKVNKAIKTKNASNDELEAGAKEAEMYGHDFPILFPNETLSRKQHVLCFILPKYIREGTCYKFMKIEQKMEYTHALMNNLETTRRNEKNRAKRFFKMIQALENITKCDRSRYENKLKKYVNKKLF